MDVFQIILLIEVGIIAVVNLLGAIPPTTMIIIGLVLILIGWFAGISLLYTLGAVLVVVGLVLWVLGASGRPVAGRARWY